MKEEINTAVRQHVLELIRSFLTKEEWKYVEEKFCRSIQRYNYNRLTRLVWEYAPKGVFVMILGERDFYDIFLITVEEKKIAGKIPERVQDTDYDFYQEVKKIRNLIKEIKSERIKS